MEARGRDDNTFRADIRAFRRVNNELPVLDIIASPLYFSPPNISTVDFVYAARSYPFQFQCSPLRARFRHVRAR